MHSTIEAGSARQGCDESDVLAYVLEVARDPKIRNLFASYPDLKHADDRAEEILPAVLAGLRRAPFDPGRPGAAAYRSYVWMHARRRFFDLARARTREAARIANHLEHMQRTVIEPDEVIWDPPAKPAEVFEGEIVGSTDAADGLPPLAEWLDGIYTAARKAEASLPGRLKQGRRGYTTAQAIACSLLKRKLKLTARGARGIFLDRADLRRATRLGDVPCFQWFADLEEVATEFLKYLEFPQGMPANGE